jgi:ParB-like chromosome segregation protein Spo0J
VQALSDSIAEIGLQTPITVTRQVEFADGQEVQVWRLIAGLHRLEAVKSLGLAEIEAVEMGDDEVLQKLWECDENLCRAELTGAQRAKFTAERKKWYEIKHPETRHGATGRGREKSCQFGDSNERFTAETAKATGRSERSVQRDALRGAKIDLDALEILEGTIGDKGVNLDAIARLDPEDQVKAARLAAQGKPFKMAADPRNDFEAKEAQVSRLMSAWNAASREAREDFLARIDRPVFDSTRAA